MALVMCDVIYILCCIAKGYLINLTLFFLCWVLELSYRELDCIFVHIHQESKSCYYKKVQVVKISLVFFFFSEGLWEPDQWKFPWDQHIVHPTQTSLQLKNKNTMHIIPTCVYLPSFSIIFNPTYSIKRLTVVISFLTWNMLSHLFWIFSTFFSTAKKFDSADRS